MWQVLQLNFKYTCMAAKVSSHLTSPSIFKTFEGVNKFNKTKLKKKSDFYSITLNQIHWALSFLLTSCMIIVLVSYKDNPFE